MITTIMSVIVGDVILVNEKNPDWAGCLMYVDKVSNWGVQAGMTIPYKGVAFLRLSWGMFDVVGELGVKENATDEPAKHGAWSCDEIREEELAYGGRGYIPLLKCSHCGITTESYMRYDKPIMPEDMGGFGYCPNCGAKMDLKEEDDEVR